MQPDPSLSLPLCSFITAAFASIGVFGCSSTSSATDGGEQTVLCVPNSSAFPVDTYTANMTKAGDQGVVRFTIVSSDPAPPHQGTNTFTLKVTNSDGTPFSGMITAPNNDPNGIWMPRHSHGSSVLDMLQPLDASQGTYTLSSVELFMPGYWQIRINAYDPSQPMMLLDYAAFHFCI